MRAAAAAERDYDMRRVRQAPGEVSVHGGRQYVCPPI